MHHVLRSAVLFLDFTVVRKQFLPICRSHARAYAQEKRDQIEEIEMGKKQRERGKNNDVKARPPWRRRAL